MMDQLFVFIVSVCLVDFHLSTLHCPKKYLELQMVDFYIFPWLNLKYWLSLCSLQQQPVLTDLQFSFLSG